jgi:hypothetical protein
VGAVWLTSAQASVARAVAEVSVFALNSNASQFVEGRVAGAAALAPVWTTQDFTADKDVYFNFNKATATDNQVLEIAALTVRKRS